LAAFSLFILVTPGCEDDDPVLYDLSLEVTPPDAGTVEGEGTYEEGEEVFLEADPNEGYGFVNWTRNGEEVSAEADFTYFMPAEDVVLTANFEEEAQLEEGLMTHWNFDDGEFPENTTPFNEENFEFIDGALGGNALEFDGESTYLEIDADVELDAHDLTLAFWVKFNEPLDREGEQVIIWNKGDAEWDSPEGYFVSSWDAENGMQKVIDLGADPAVVLQDERARADIFTAGEWAHLAFTFEEGEAKKMYINGEVIAEEEADALQPYTGTSWMGFNCPEFEGAFFNGAIDDFRVYEKVFTEEEVQDLIDLQ